jgi:predicted RNase H-like HicB family nuclease
MAQITFHVSVNEEEDGSFWAEVKELPGCFASGFSVEELQEAVLEAIQLCLPEGITLDHATWDMGDEERPHGRRPARKRQVVVCA